jgi:hypothetical protein
MTNQERLQEYLVGNNGYLKNDISNGKVIMLSGKWGSGKTHFWQNIIAKDLTENQTKKQKAYVYSSLYGNRTIDKIEDNIYAQAYLCSVGGKNAVLSGYETVKDFGKRFGSFCSLLDVSKLIDGLDDIQQKNIKKSALSYLENGGIVCFDDFERKSKDIDLNDLFGFISHLAIDLKCKVVIILNDDVFEGVEKDVFSRVKEKSVSKFLKYEPSIRDLFKTIFTKDKKYRILDEHKEIILKTIEETKELNGRIYIQILDNLAEWVYKKQVNEDSILRYIVFTNINFIVYNVTLLTIGKAIDKDNKEYFFNKFTDNLSELSNAFNCIKYNPEDMDSSEDEFKSFDTVDEYLKMIEEKIFSDNKLINYKEYFNKNKILYEAKFYATRLDIAGLVDIVEQCKINNFTETGILINE